MGDRRNIYFVDQIDGGRAQGFYLYSHWSGSELDALLRNALDHARNRWGDPAYCSRIIVSRIIPRGDHEGERGWGLSTEIQDHEHDSIIVDQVAHRVWDCPAGVESQAGLWRNPRNFEQYVNPHTKTPVPTHGQRIQIQGKVVSTEVREAEWGLRYVGTIQTDEGYRVWGTIPSDAFAEVRDDLGRAPTHTHIRLRARLKPSPDDSTFGFIERPTGANAYTPDGEKVHPSNGNAPF